MIRCFRKIEVGETGRRGVWIMVRDKGTQGAYFHGDRNEVQPSAYPVEELMSLATKGLGGTHMKIEGITEYLALEELRSWRAGFAAAEQIIAKQRPIPKQDQEKLLHSFGVRLITRDFLEQTGLMHGLPIPKPDLYAGTFRLRVCPSLDRTLWDVRIENDTFETWTITTLELESQVLELCHSLGIVLKSVQDRITLEKAIDQTHG